MHGEETIPSCDTMTEIMKLVMGEVIRTLPDFLGTDPKIEITEKVEEPKIRNLPYGNLNRRKLRIRK